MLFIYWSSKLQILICDDSEIWVEIDIIVNDFSNTNISDACLNGALCIGSKFSGVEMSRINLVQADLTGDDLSRAERSKASLVMAEMNRRKLVGIKLTAFN